MYTVVGLKDTEKKNAVRIDKDGRRFICLAVMKEKYRLTTKMEINGEIDKDIEYAYKDNWFFKHCYDSESIEKLFELAMRVVI